MAWTIIRLSVLRETVSPVTLYDPPWLRIIATNQVLVLGHRLRSFAVSRRIFFFFFPFSLFSLLSSPPRFGDEPTPRSDLNALLNSTGASHLEFFPYPAVVAPFSWRASTAFKKEPTVRVNGRVQRRLKDYRRGQSAKKAAPSTFYY